MKPYSEFRPTAFDHHLEIEGIENWLVLPVTQNRDSDTLARSNFDAAVATLTELDDHEDWDVLNFGHWACGWFEIIVVKPGTRVHTVALEIEASLADYPVLDEELFSNMECEEHDQDWDSWVCRDFENELTVKFDDHLGELTEEDAEQIGNLHRFLELIDNASKDELRELYAATEPPDDDWDVERAVSEITYGFLLKYWPDPDPPPAKDPRQMELKL